MSGFFRGEKGVVGFFLVRRGVVVHMLCVFQIILVLIIRSSFRIKVLLSHILIQPPFQSGFHNS